LALPFPESFLIKYEGGRLPSLAEFRLDNRRGVDMKLPVLDAEPDDVVVDGTTVGAFFFPLMDPERDDEAEIWRCSAEEELEACRTYVLRVQGSNDGLNDADSVGGLVRNRVVERVQCE